MKGDQIESLISEGKIQGMSWREQNRERVRGKKSFAINMCTS